MTADHRRNPNRRGFVPSSWLIVSAVAACAAATVWLALQLMGSSSTSDTASDDPAPEPTATAVATTPAPSPTPTPTPEPTETEEPEVTRDSPVAIFNNTRIQSLAATYSGRAQNAGWSINAVGNWRGQIPSNTVYYPGDLEAQGKLLADDLGISRVMPAVEGMDSNRLTVVLSGPQQ